MTVAFSSLLFMSAVWVGELFFIEDVLGRGDLGYGLMLSIWTVGMALGALLLSRRVAAGAVAATGLAAVAVQGAALALPASGSASHSSSPVRSWAAWRTGSRTSCFGV